MASHVSETEVKKIIIERLKTVPDEFKLVIGSHGTFSKEQMIEEVLEDSDVGKKIVEIQLDYLRSLKNWH